MKEKRPGRSLARRETRKKIDGLLHGVMPDFALVAGAAGDRDLSRSEEEELIRIKKDRGAEFYSELLFVLTQQDFSSTGSRRIWRNILVHKAKLAALLGRNVGITVAALDYLGNLRDHLDEPAVVADPKVRAIKEEAVIDSITSLRDAPSFTGSLELEIVRHRLHGSPVTVVLAALDGIDRVREERGYAEGDAVVAAVGEIVGKTARELDVCGRYGREEFALLLPQTDVEDGSALSERLRRRVEQNFGKRLGVTVSVGVAGCPTHARKALSLLRRAEEAMRRSCREGGNIVTVR